jgi:large subunit ribosomal protein L9
MKIVLLDDVDNLGEAGDIVDVKGGYARNFLIPNKLAGVASKDVINRIEQIRKTGEARRMSRLKEEKEIIESISGKTITIYARAGNESRLFGAVTNATISDAISSSLGVGLDRKFVRLQQPIKHLGDFEVELRASRDIKGSITVAVKNEEDREADLAAAASPATQVAENSPQAEQDDSNAGEESLEAMAADYED